MNPLLWAMFGAGVGAPTRWWTDQWIQRGRRGVFPWGTLTINVLGSALLGLLVGSGALGTDSPSLLALLGTGFCGGFTTFSTFGYETVRLAEDGSYAEAGANVVVSVVAALVASVVGWWLGAAVWQ